MTMPYVNDMALAAVYGWFTAGLDTADLQEARVLLEALRGDGISG